MKRLGFVLAAISSLCAQNAQREMNSDLVVRAETLHTGVGAAIKDGVVLIQGGRITAVGAAASVKVPAGITVRRAKVAVPGLVDAHGTAGFSGLLNQPHDQEQVERSAPMQPELRAIDGFNGRDPLLGWLRDRGVTTIHTGHGPGTLVAGETLVAKTFGDEVDQAVLKAEAMIAATLGDSAKATEPAKAPGTRAKQVAMVRQALVDAQEYLKKLASPEKGKEAARDLRKEAFAAVLKGERPLLLTVNRAADILAALRIKEEFKIPVVLDGAAEAFLVLAQIKAAGVAVVLHPSMARAHGEMENLSLETAAKLKAAGIPFALQSGYEGYVPKTRVVLWEAAMAAANGLTFEEALATITRDAAKIAGVADRVGSLEVGKDGDVACYDGDPFEWTTHCTGTVIQGRVVSEGEKY
ncbi:MAG: amidohydrolase family protein [Acidobacteria bacterium]|nr:amidohydrolase family protein [Acidobacteriota bacterium]